MPAKLPNFPSLKDHILTRVQKVASLTGILTVGGYHCPKSELLAGSAQKPWFPGKAKMVRTTLNLL